MTDDKPYTPDEKVLQNAEAKRNRKAARRKRNHQAQVDSDAAWAKKQKDFFEGKKDAL